MNAKNMSVKIVKFDDVNSPDIIHIRSQVFVEEQGIDPKLDFDGLDEIAMQVLVVIDGMNVGTGRMLNDGHIGRIAVLKSARKLGVGSTIISVLINEAKKKNYRRVYLGSQMHAKEFYKKLGFNTCGEVFMDAGLEHIEMEILLV